MADAFVTSTLPGIPAPSVQFWPDRRDSNHGLPLAMRQSTYTARVDHSARLGSRHGRNVQRGDATWLTRRTGRAHRPPRRRQRPRPTPTRPAPPRAGRRAGAAGGRGGGAGGGGGGGGGGAPPAGGGGGGGPPAGGRGGGGE